VRITFLVCITLLVGCSREARAKELSSPHVSCSEDDMTIFDGEGTNESASWNVSCPDGTYYHCIGRARPYFGGTDTMCEATAR
jgi:hypothetical protein